MLRFPTRNESMGKEISIGKSVLYGRKVDTHTRWPLPLHGLSSFVKAAKGKPVKGTVGEM